MLSHPDDDLNLPSSCSKENFITATIDRLENQHAILQTADGQKIVWPIDKLNECREGETVRLILQTNQDQTLARQQTAKEILNYILNNQPTKTNEKNKNN